MTVFFNHVIIKSNVLEVSLKAEDQYLINTDNCSELELNSNQEEPMVSL